MDSTFGSSRLGNLLDPDGDECLGSGLGFFLIRSDKSLDLDDEFGNCCAFDDFAT